MRAAILAGARQQRVEAVPDAVPGPRDIVVRVDVCGVCGSDLHEYVRPTAVEPGQVMGHEPCGEIVARGADGDSRLMLGDRVMAVPLVQCGRCARCTGEDPHLCERRMRIAFDGVPGGFAEYLRIPDAVLGVGVFVVPDPLDAREGALAEPLAVSLHAVGMLRPGQDRVVCVAGAGTIGLGVVQLARRRGVERIIVVEPSEVRRRAAASLGADLTVAPGPELVVELRDAARGELDVLIDCSSDTGMIAAGLHTVRRGGQVVAVSQYPGEMQLDPRLLMNGERTVRGSFSSRPWECETVLRMLAAGTIDAKGLLGDTYGLAEVNEAFERALDVNRAAGKVQVLPQAR